MKQLPDPKLKAAMAEIKEIIKKNDLAGFVVLYREITKEGKPANEATGASEYILELEPSYSAIEWDRDTGKVIVHGKKEHYDGYDAIKKRALAVTVNMLSMLSDTAGPLILKLMDLARNCERTWGTVHFDPPEQEPNDPDRT